MSEMWSGLAVAAPLAAALVLFLLELGFSVILASVAALGPVALRRLSREPGPHAMPLGQLERSTSPYRTAVSLARQLCLTGGCLLLILAAMGAEWRYPGIVGLTLGTLIGVLLVEGLVARSLAVLEPETALRRTAPLSRVAYVALYPVVRPLAALHERIGDGSSGAEEQREDEEVDAFIEVGQREGILEATEGEMVRSIVDLGETKVREIMTPRTGIRSVAADTTVAAASAVMVQAGHSRLPVFRETIDNVVGILHGRDLLRAWESGQQGMPVADWLREAMFVPETLTVAELLVEMRVRTHMAMVVDEYGGVAGLVTLEDLLEEIVGDIRDEHETEAPLLNREPDGSWTVDATAHVEELERLFDVEIAERDFDTVGGLVVSGFGRVPAEGESLELQGLRIHVLKADPRRIHYVRVTPVDRGGELQATS